MKNFYILNNGSTFFSFQSYQCLLKMEYLSILIYLFVAITLSIVILVLSYLLAVQNPETEKMSAYECGFEPYQDAREKFDVKYYLIAMLFIVFDIETMFLIPWCSSFVILNGTAFWAMIDFVLELGVGLLYVWFIGGLDWDSITDISN
jgi:NADH-quinone oxidoreductase subunit A